MLSVKTTRTRRRVAGAALLSTLLVVQGLGATPSHADLPGPTDGGRAIITRSETRTVAEGIVHSTYDRIDERGKNHIQVLKVDLSKTTVDYLDAGKVAGVATLSTMASAADVDVAVNGDFFDINNSGAALGAGVDVGGNVVKSPNDNHREAAVVTKDGLGAITSLLLDGEMVVNDATSYKVRGLNMQILPAGIGVYDHQWGTYRLTRPLQDDATHLAVRVGADGKVTAVGEQLGDNVNIPQGEKVVLARGEEAVNQLKAVNVGDTVKVSIGVSDNVENLAFAIGGNWATLVSGGNPLSRPEGSKDAFVDNLHPRTAIGFGDGGRTMILVTVDGRGAGGSRGINLPELGRLMVELGATEAMNLDGGGSTTMVVRDAGNNTPEVVNNPSDGSERRDGNGMGVVSNGSDGVLSGIALAMSGVKDNASRIFPGLQRTVVAKPHDKGGRPVQVEGMRWTSSNPAVATVDENGVVTGVAPGTARINVTVGKVTASTNVTVLGDLARLIVTPNVMQFPAKDVTNRLNVVGVDKRGFRAPIDPADITVAGVSDELRFDPGTETTFRAVSLVDKAGGNAVIQVGGEAAEVGFLIGRDTELVTDFNNASQDEFRFDSARSTNSIELREGEGTDGGKAMAMTMDFSQQPGTRTFNLRPNAGTHAIRNFEGQPVELRVTLKGDGVHTPMTYMQVRNAAGAPSVQYGPRIKATKDWQTVVIPVPSGYSGPFYWSLFAFYETTASSLYKTTVLVDKVELVVAPNAEAPAFQEITDPMTIDDGGATDDAPLRVAIMGDAQFVGRNPNSSLVQNARRTLQEMVAAKPDAIYIVGDFVDEAADIDFELAKKIIDEEVVPSGIPWTYIPGNHEIMGAPISNFIKWFGDNHTTKDYGSTRVITLDSSPYDLPYAELKYLREQLDATAADDSITGVLVMFHHPTQDFLPSNASGLKGNTGRLVEEWLSRFSDTSGKHISVFGAGVGAFHARQQDGVVHYTNGNSGKAATSNVGWGGWRGWTMLGVDPAKGDSAAYPVTDWLDIETKPWVDADSVEIRAEKKDVAQHESQFVEAEFKQDGTAIPVKWPVSAKWGGEGVHVGPIETAPEDAVAVFNSQTRQITFIRDTAREVTLTLDVNGQKASYTFNVAKSSEPTQPTPEPSPTETVTGPAVTVTPTVTGEPVVVTPTVTGAPITVTPTVTGEPVVVTPTVTGAPITVTPTTTGEPVVVTPTVTGAPITVTPTVTGEPVVVTPTVTGAPITVTPTVTGAPSPSAPAPKPTTPAPKPSAPVLKAPYEVPGFHTINGRRWNTTCEPYGNTIRCWTYIWSKQAVKENGQYKLKEGWHFNNLTYLPYLTKAQWGTHHLANTGEYTINGRKWRTECNTKVTGKNACRSYIWATVIVPQRDAQGRYTFRQNNQWVFNNMVRFKVS